MATYAGAVAASAASATSAASAATTVMRGDHGVTKSHDDMHEGADALDRFRKAMKTIVSVPKSSVMPARDKAPAKRKKAPKP